MTDVALMWSIIGGVLAGGVSYGGLYTTVRGTAGRVSSLEKEVRYDEEELARHVNDVVDRLARIERNVEILVKKAGL